MHMKKAFHLVIAIFSTSAVAGKSDAPASYQERGYVLEKLTQKIEKQALNELKSVKIFQHMRGAEKKCKAVYRLSHSDGPSVGYAAVCMTGNRYRRDFFCWSASGEHFGYAPDGYDAGPEWVADSILHGCGGELVTAAGNRKQGAEVDTSPPRGVWKLTPLGWGKRRPVMTMLKADIEYYGFSIPLAYCENTRYISLGWDRNTHYATICEIDETGKEALICFDNLEGHFALFTRYQDTPEWIENTIYRHCWAKYDSLVIF